MMRQEEQNIMILPVSSNFYNLESVFKSNSLFHPASSLLKLLNKVYVIWMSALVYSKKNYMIVTFRSHRLLNPIELKNFLEIFKFYQKIDIYSDSI